MDYESHGKTPYAEVQLKYELSIGSVKNLANRQGPIKEGIVFLFT